MNKTEKHLMNMLHSIDEQELDKIASFCPSASERTKDMLFMRIENRNGIMTEQETFEVSTAPKFSIYRNAWAAAACLLVCAGTIGSVYALNRSGMNESVQTAEELTTETTIETIEEETAPSETNAPRSTETIPAKETSQAEVIITEETNPTEMTEAIETEAPVIVQEMSTTALTSAAVKQTAETTITETAAVLIETEEPEIIEETEPETEIILTLEEPEIITANNTEPETEPVTEPITEAETEFQLIRAETDENGRPVLPGFTVEYFETEVMGYFRYKDADGVEQRREDTLNTPHVRISPAQNETEQDEIYQRYQPSYLPEGVAKKDSEWNDASDELYKEMLNTEDDAMYLYEQRYTDETADCSIELMQQCIITKDGFKNTFRYYEEEQWGGNAVGEYVNDDRIRFYPVTVGGRPGFIYTMDSSRYITDGATGEKKASTLMQFDIIWEKDGYLFTMQVWNRTPDDFDIPELLKMAASVQSID